MKHPTGGGFIPPHLVAVGQIRKGIKIMRKIILASAIAVSALGLAACSETTEENAEDTVEGAAADTEANLDAMGDEMEEAAADTEAAAEDATAEAEEEATEAEADIEGETEAEAAAD
ncbi:outer membrane murein-binding lipoprotein Lpp [Erythrobacter lutimaris]|nr:outer membrane murein-binding lipoprotein Lpp [Alteriqipengyuania lutimaris]